MSRSGPRVALLLFLVLGAAGCAKTIPAPTPVSLRAGIPPDSGLAFGRVELFKNFETYVELRNVVSDRRVTLLTDKSNEFFILLPAGQYQITRLGRGAFEFTAPKHGGYFFRVPPGGIVYVGTLLVQPRGDPQSWRMWVYDEFVETLPALRARYPMLQPDKLPHKGLMRTRLETR